MLIAFGYVEDGKPMLFLSLSEEERGWLAAGKVIRQPLDVEDPVSSVSVLGAENEAAKEWILGMCEKFDIEQSTRLASVGVLLNSKEEME